MLCHLMLHRYQLSSARRTCVLGLVLACFANAVLGCAAESDDPAKPDNREPGGAPEGGFETEPSSEPNTAGSPMLGADDPGADDVDAAGAMGNAYAALHAANYDALPDLIARLDSVLERQPMQGRVAFYAGVMRLWRATGAPRQLGQMFTDVTQAIKLLERAHALRPEDYHAGAFLGVAQVALGNVASDDERLAQGRKILEETLPLYPAYVNGVLAQALGMVPRDHPFFADAAAAVRASLAACGNSASALETLTFAYPEKHELGSCNNGGIVAHVWEGISLIAGDIFVKGGDAEAGRRMYDNAKLSPTYARWPFKEQLERRIADADARKALYVDGTKDNDPVTWMQETQLCVGCHADER